MRIKLEEQNVFRQENARRLKVSDGNKTTITMTIILVLLFFASIFLPVVLSSKELSLAWFFEMAGKRMAAFGAWVGGGTPTNSIHFVTYRYIIIALVGGALAACGAVYQGSFKNAMASPATLGVQSGGSLAGLIYILFFAGSGTYTVAQYSELKAFYDNQSVWMNNLQALMILAGCFLGVLLIVSISRAAGHGKVNSVALILSGTVFSSLISGAVGLAQYYIMMMDPDDSRVNALRSLMLGTFDKAFTLDHLLLVAVPTLICLTVIFCMRSKLNVIVFGEDEARAMGVKVDRTRNIFIAMCTILTAVTISFCGQIGFIGLMVPHMARLIVGPDFRALVPASTLLGAIVMLIVYDFAYGFGYASNINVVTSVVGGLAFLIFMSIYRRKRNADWA